LLNLPFLGVISFVDIVGGYIKIAAYAAKKPKKKKFFEVETSATPPLSERARVFKPVLTVFIKYIIAYKALIVNRLLRLADFTL